MRTHLVGHGDAHALLLDKSLPGDAQIDPMRPVEVTTAGQRLIVTPVDSSKEEPVTDALEAVNQIHGKRSSDSLNKSPSGNHAAAAAPSSFFVGINSERECPEFVARATSS